MYVINYYTDGTEVARSFCSCAPVYNKKLSRQRFLSVIQNHIAERHWVEVNSRVNYPLKAALTWMQSNSIIDLDCPVTKFCVSLMTGKLSQVGIKLHVRSWNNHRIPGE